jgi:signal transduction histidine kinase
VLETSDGALWVGTLRSGLIRYAGGRSRSFTTKDGLCVQVPYVLYEGRSERLWVGGETTGSTPLCRFEAGRFRPLPMATTLGRIAVRAVHESRDGRLRVAARHIHRLEGDRFVEEPIEGSRFTLLWIHEDRQGRLWTGGHNGLWWRDEHGWTKPPFDRELPGRLVLAVHEDDSNDLWFGTDRGLTRYRDGKLRRYTATTGLVDDPVVGIVTEGDNVWFGSTTGVYRVARADFDALDDGGITTTTYRHFGVADGLPSAVLNRGPNPAIGKSRDGRLWFPTTMGMAWVNPRALDPPPAPLLVSIQQVLIDRVPFRPQADGTIVAPRGRGALWLTFAAPALTDAEHVRFRHKLEPVDREWLEGAGLRTARYASLPAGNYRFLVEATRGAGSWSRPAVPLVLRLEPPLIDRPAFRAGLAVAMVLAAAVIVVSLHRRRMAQLVMRHHAVLTERARIAREIHDTLAQGLAGLALRLEAALQKLAGAPPSTRAELEAALRLARQSVVDGRRAIWGLRHQALESANLAGALSRMAAAIESNVPVRIDIVGVVGDLPAEQEQVLLVVAQEAIANAIRHASATSVHVTLAYDVDTVELHVADDGRGFDPDRVDEKCFGLVGIRERVSAAGGQVSVRSRIGGGTEIDVRFGTPRTAAAETISKKETSRA